MLAARPEIEVTTVTRARAALAPMRLALERTEPLEPGSRREPLLGEPAVRSRLALPLEPRVLARESPEPEEPSAQSQPAPGKISREPVARPG